MNTKWHFKTNDADIIAVLETEVKEFPLVSIDQFGVARTHNIDGEVIQFLSSSKNANFNLVQNHPCELLNSGDLIMVWDDCDIANASLRKLYEINDDGKSVKVLRLSDLSTKYYSWKNALPLEAWKDKIFNSEVNEYE